MKPEAQLVMACIGLMLLTFAVGLLMLRRRVRAMRANRIRSQSVALSAQRAAGAQVGVSVQAVAEVVAPVAVDGSGFAIRL